jgi:hypothetical protein
MFYRLALTLGLLVLPLATAEASYQQNYRLPAAEATPQTVQQQPQEDVRPVKDADGVSVWETDGSAVMTRAVFTANLIRGMYTQTQIDNCFWDIAPSHPPRFDLVFTDVSVDDPYAKEICVAMRDGIVRGYIDGSFGPDRTLTFAESAKILSRAYVLAPYAHADVRSPWYAGHVRALVARNAVPLSITKLNQTVTASEAKEMLVRLESGITWRPSQTEQVLFPPVVVRRPAAVTPATGSSSSSAPQTTSKASVKNTSSAASIGASSAVPEMPTSSKRSFWDLF